jgi:hypothetical protein
VEIWVSARVPDSHHFNHWRLALHAIVEVVLNYAQENAAHTRKLDVGRDRSYLRLSADQFECLVNGIPESVRRSRTILVPPFRSCANLAGGPASGLQWQPWAQSRRSSRKSSSPEITSPRSASSIEARRAASASGPSVKVPRSSGVKMVTTIPSANSSSATSILPLTTRPVVTRIILFYLKPAVTLPRGPAGSRRSPRVGSICRRRSCR